MQLWEIPGYLGFDPFVELRLLTFIRPGGTDVAGNMQVATFESPQTPELCSSIRC